MTQIHGEVAEGFGAVGDAFADNFDDRGEVGAAFCLYVGVPAWLTSGVGWLIRQPAAHGSRTPSSCTSRPPRA